MKLPKIDITENQKKIVIFSAIGLFIFTLLWVFVYYPSSKEITNLTCELASTERQIQGIERFLVGSKSQDEAIRLLKQRQQYLNNKFPQKEEESLRLISEVAHNMNIEVVILEPQARMELMDTVGKQVTIEGKVVSFLPINLEIICFYRELIKYVQELKVKLPAFISVNSFSIKKEDQLNGKIRVNLNFDLYLLI